MDIFMKSAIQEARKGLAEGGIPIGSVLVKEGRIIGRGHNQRVQKGNPIAHAEIDCLQDAGRIGNYKDTVLYSTLMPCYLCAGAVVQFGIKKVVVGESRNFGGALQFMRQHGVEVIDLDNNECYEMMLDFIRKNPVLWYEDIGK
ncbi:MAG: nucleoside deaminase [Candidatus Methanoperedens sp.]|nr:nucleoside deaminase [Candidatus Methanoperedens sp.]